MRPATRQLATDLASCTVQDSFTDKQFAEVAYMKGRAVKALCPLAVVTQHRGLMGRISLFFHAPKPNRKQRGLK